MIKHCFQIRSIKSESQLIYQNKNQQEDVYDHAFALPRSYDIPENNKINNYKPNISKFPQNNPHKKHIQTWMLDRQS